LWIRACGLSSSPLESCVFHSRLEEDAGFPYMVFCYLCICDRRDLHSFPTRRSSDLRSNGATAGSDAKFEKTPHCGPCHCPDTGRDRKSTRLNSSHVKISYAVFCLKKKNLEQMDVCPTSVPWHFFVETPSLDYILTLL